MQAKKSSHMFYEIRFETLLTTYMST